VSAGLLSVGAGATLFGSAIFARSAIDSRHAHALPPEDPKRGALVERADRVQNASEWFASLGLVSAAIGAALTRRQYTRCDRLFADAGRAFEAINAFNDAEYQRYTKLYNSGLNALRYLVSEGVQAPWEVPAYEPHSAEAGVVIAHTSAALGAVGISARFVPPEVKHLHEATLFKRVFGKAVGRCHVLTPATIVLRVVDPALLIDALDRIEPHMVRGPFGSLQGNIGRGVKHIACTVQNALAGVVEFPALRESIRPLQEKLERAGIRCTTRESPHDLFKAACDALNGGYFDGFVACRNASLFDPRPKFNPKDWLSEIAAEATDRPPPEKHVLQYHDEKFLDRHDAALAALEKCVAALKISPAPRGFFAYVCDTFGAGLVEQRRLLAEVRIAPERRERLTTIVEESEFRLEQQFRPLLASGKLGA
jgi:hypothetical protein